MHKRLFIIIGAGFLASCQKNDDHPVNSWSWFGTHTSAVYNYVLINATQVLSTVDSNEMHVGVSAAFVDSNNHQVATVSTLRINNREISAGSDYLYNYIYGSADPGSEPGFGTDVKVNIQGTEADDTVSSQVYLPKRLKTISAGFPTEIARQGGYALTWLPDHENAWGNVMIQLYYFNDLSRRQDASLPASIETVNLTVPDTGSYMLTATDLSNFPKNAFVGITIARGTQNEATLPLSRKRVYYFTSAALSTPPIRIVQ